ncbi:MAG: hypothetical protein HYT07_03685 [Candidatus Levybacteria bacterium]|nr:hypothetical protein [Candidatus Levybacteria bacterium]
MNDIFVAPKNHKGDIIKKHVGGLKLFSLLKQDGPHMNIFSSFCKDPKGVTFQTQKQGEVIILFLRSHFITNLYWIAISIVLIFIPLIIAIFSSLFEIRILSSPIASHFMTVYILFYYLIVFSFVFVNFLHWFYNVFIVTSERVVDIDYSDIVIHNIAVTKLSHVQDVNYTQSGFIPTLFNYGNLFVQTAGTEINFEATAVPKPREATHIIGDLIGKAK